MIRKNNKIDAGMKESPIGTIYYRGKMTYYHAKIENDHAEMTYYHAKIENDHVKMIYHYDNIIYYRIKMKYYRWFSFLE